MQKKNCSFCQIYQKFASLYWIKNISADEHIMNLCTTLERSGSIWINSKVISIVILIQLWLYASICRTPSFRVKNLPGACQSVSQSIYCRMWVADPAWRAQVVFSTKVSSENLIIFFTVEKHLKESYSLILFGILTI